MTQDVFCSMYTKDYKWWENVARPPMERGIDIAEDPEKYVKFLSPQELKPGRDSADAIKHLHRLWWKSTYRVDYCEERFPRAEAADADGEVAADPLRDDELMDSLGRALNPVERRLLPPPGTSRVVYSHCPVRRFRTGRTFYADAHSRPAYDRLRRLVLDRGSRRPAAPAAPVRYPEPDYSTPPCRQGRGPAERTWIHLRPDPFS